MHSLTDCSREHWSFDPPHYKRTAHSLTPSESTSSAKLPCLVSTSNAMLSGFRGWGLGVRVWKLDTMPSYHLPGS